MEPIPLKKINSILLFSILIGVILFYAKKVLIIVVFSMMLAMLMTPVANKLEQWKIGRVLSTIICLFIVILVLTAIISLISAQIASLGQDLPLIQGKLEKYLHDFQTYIQNKFNISSERQIDIVKEQARSFMQSAGNFITKIIKGFAGTIGSLLVTLVFMFLLLFQREKYETFILKLYKGEKPERAKEVIQKISKVSRQYLWGRLLSIIILTIMYSVGLLIIGIKNAILLSAIAALLTFIPYIGPVIGGMFPFFMAMITENSFGPALAVAGVIILIQTIDNYFIEPYIVGGEVHISAFFTILVLIVGGFVWGIAGVILFLPMLGMAKIIFDHIEPLKPYGYLVGDQKQQQPYNKLWERIKKKIRGKNKDQ